MTLLPSIRRKAREAAGELRALGGFGVEMVAVVSPPLSYVSFYLLEWGMSSR